MKHVIVMIFVIFVFLGCRRDHMDETQMIITVSPVVYYGDINNDAVIAIDIDKMELQEVIASNGIYPYEVAQGFDKDLYVINRDDYNLGVLNTETNTIDTHIDLNFIPRSIAINANDTLLSSVNEPSSAVVTADIVSDTYSDSTYTLPTSFGGSNATGHPVWIDDNYFLLLDRTENTIELYEKGTYAPVSKLVTNSSVHHVMSRDGFYYGIAEGEQNVVSPGIVKFTVSNGSISLVKERLLSSFAGLPSDFNSTTWGSHHGALHPSADYIYVGSAEGNVFVLDLADLDLADTFRSGKGVGHFLFHNDMLITTNHYDTFKSFYNAVDPTANEFIQELHFSTVIYDGITMQSHTSHIVDDKLYFTFNTNINSTLYKVNLLNISIEESLTLTGRYCLMGSFTETVSNGM
jgi:hypothetical protein